MIIGIVGHSGSGKDTMAERLVSRWGFVSVSLADPLKRICQDVFGFTDEQMWGPSEFRNAPDRRYGRDDGTFLTPRLALQTLGTDWGRSCHENIWVKHAMRTASSILAGCPYSKKHGVDFSNAYAFKRPVVRGVVIPDVRFVNEVQSIRDSGKGIIVRIHRSGKDGSQIGGVEGHKSELEMEKIPKNLVDFFIRVPEGISPFYDEIDRTMSKISSEISF